MFEELRKFEVGQFDTIICFGFFYYGMRQAELLSEIERIKPKTLILDTLIAQVPRLLKVAKFLRKTGLLRLIEHQRLDCTDFKSYKKQLGNEPISHIDQLLDEKYLVYLDYFSDNEKILPFEYHRFYATDKVMQMLLIKYGFHFRKLNWHNAGVEEWTNLGNYKHGNRVSYIASLNKL
ncbi:hypothetical protein [Coleofasciculus sp.]|uniref:hypothetical protein n=1 Tax=Coleofasciculus sp. TaxID=3100458 RepID=UPI0039F85D19